MRPLLNAPFGACFELDAKSKGLVRCDPAKPELEEDDEDDEEGEGDGGRADGGRADGGIEGHGAGGDGGLLPASSAAAAAAAPDEELANEVRNNASLQDAGGAAQSLKHDEIDALRASGAKGSEIVAALVAGSSTFASKTALSQQKWVRRKVRKHVVRVSIRRPSAAALAAHAARGRGRGGTSSSGGSSGHTGGNATIGCLRPEGVSLLLNLGGVGPRARVLVVDGVGGLLAAAVAERLGGHGLAVVAFGGSGGGGGGGGDGNDGRGSTGRSSAKRGRNNAPSSTSSSNSGFCSPPQLDSLRHVDVSQTARDAVVTAPLPALLEAAAEARENEKRGGGGGEEKEEEMGQEKEEREEEQRGREEEEEASKKKPTPASELVDPAGAERAAARKAASARRRALARAAAARGFDAFVCAAPSLNPKALLMAVAPLLGPSASFAMHVAWLQPAAELASAAMEGSGAGRRARNSPGVGDGYGGAGENGGAEEEEATAAATPFAAAAVHLVEPWLRRYQILPRRTHPEMWASGTGGYLVHGVSLPEGGGASCGGERAAEAAAEKKAAETNGATAAPSPASASAEKATTKRKDVAVANDEYDPELSD